MRFIKREMMSWLPWGLLTAALSVPLLLSQFTNREKTSLFCCVVDEDMRPKLRVRRCDLIEDRLQKKGAPGLKMPVNL